MLEGSLREVRFAWPGQNEDHLKEMRQIGSSVVQTNDVCYINGNKPDQPVYSTMLTCKCKRS